MRGGHRESYARASGSTFSAAAHRRQPRDRVCCPGGSEEPYLRCQGPSPNASEHTCFSPRRRDPDCYLRVAAADRNGRSVRPGRAPVQAVVDLNEKAADPHEIKV